MASPLADHPPAMSVMLIQHWRETPVWQKLAYVNELNQTLQTLATSDLRRRYPSESDAQIRRRLAARWLGAAVAARVYGAIAEDGSAAD